jgi:hypothetical protein
MGQLGNKLDAESMANVEDLADLCCWLASLEVVDEWAAYAAKCCGINLGQAGGDTNRADEETKISCCSDWFSHFGHRD